MTRDSIFISYSHKDVKWLNEIKTHLSILQHNYNLIIWDDTKIKVGSNWKEEILQSIKRCKVAILLVSSNFLASEFVLKEELPRILKGTRQDGLIIFNIIIDACTFQLTELKTFQCLNDPANPIEELKGPIRKRVLVNLATELLSVMNKSGSVTDDESSQLSDEENMQYSLILILAYLSKTGAKTITDIQNATLIRRKIIVLSLEQLKNQGLIEKYQDNEKKKCSILWKVSTFGLNVFIQFEKVYNAVNNLPGT